MHFVEIALESRCSVFVRKTHRAFVGQYAEIGQSMPQYTYMYFIERAVCNRLTSSLNYHSDCYKILFRKKDGHVSLTVVDVNPIRTNCSAETICI